MIKTPPKIHPSILCANHGEIKTEVENLTAAGVDCFHIDVMDGNFVPNFGCGTEIIKAVKNSTHLPLDIHLMIQNPAQHIDFFANLGANIISIHPEADHHAARTLSQIRNMGAVPGIAINPGTSIETIKELLPLCGHVLAMTVNPGFAGQAFLDFTLAKLKVLGALAHEYGFSLCVDGNITVDKIAKLHPLGVTNYVMGTALLGAGARSSEEYAQIMEDIRRLKV